jgi:hypothetical protein
MMGSKGPGGPTPAQNLEAPRTLSMAAQPDVSSLDQPSAKDMKMGRRRQPPAALGASAACARPAVRSDELEEGALSSSSARAKPGEDRRQPPRRSRQGALPPAHQPRLGGVCAG